MAAAITTARLRALRETVRCWRIGIAYAGQEVAALAARCHDERLDWIVTEKGAQEVRLAMRILFIGDVIGKPGRDVVAAELPRFARHA